MPVHVPPPVRAERDDWGAVRAALEAAPHRPDGWTEALARIAAHVGARGARLEGAHGLDRWTAASAGPAADGPIQEKLAARIACADLLEFRLILVGDGGPIADLCPPAVGPALALAVRTQLTIEAEAVRMATGLLRRAGLQPIVCTPDGDVLDGPDGEAQARLPLRLAGGRISAACRSEDALLRAAVRAAAEHGREQVLVLGRDTDSPAVADVLPPLTGPPCFRRHALILLRGRSGGSQGRAPILQQLYGLTSAEAMIAVAVAEGAPVADIAARRGVAASTVRAQVKTVLAKVGVGRQVELVQRLAAVC
ncbi:hypothetical protein [Phenylobacterium sp. J367]|uniref:helix-turn-helix transcriptional regulator n=1 Tax=Phenylobacterium sp. J367 TaxID=2898435 RepID=UPI0021519AFA|nr:hypothetical protein [Phenylobacterium sp. J367]MCR5879700.1 hypothetical protein [Phenylobacterium sp. J367]